jgi:hypothetical protein
MPRMVVELHVHNLRNPCAVHLSSLLYALLLLFRLNIGCVYAYQMYGVSLLNICLDELR